MAGSPFSRKIERSVIGWNGTLNGSADFIALQSKLETSRAVWSWDIRSNKLSWSTPDTNDSEANEDHGRSNSVVVARELIESSSGWLGAAIRRVLQSGRPAHLTYQTSGQEGHHERWLEVTIAPVVEHDTIVKLLGFCHDTTDHMQCRHELHVRSHQQEVLTYLGARALIERDLQTFFNEVVVSVGEILKLELVKILELLPSNGELLLRAGIGWRDGLVGTARVKTGRDSQAGYTLAAGRAVIVEDLKSETRFKGQFLLHQHGVMSGISAPIASSDGRAYGVISAHTRTSVKFKQYDASFITSVANILAGAIRRNQLDQRHEQMIRELRHRSGNLFAQLLSLFSQTAKNSRNLPDLTEKFEGRVLAMANAHRLITEAGWSPTSLVQLLANLFATHRDRVELRGPDMLIEPDPTLGLSVALHELVTNACQHGSLCGADGRVLLAWSAMPTSLGPTLSIDWRETGGVGAAAPIQPGFGSRLIKMAIERQLNGRVEQEFGPSGLSVRLSVPLTGARWAQSSGASTGALPKDQPFLQL